ncbi:protein FAR1-RELATED SEQUENCE 6-like [Carya illinoinensis]|uniref:protein FAR1-RELATED SEQUENCE 6-like n=1 Tax=Carya illinoinensis TaxID=32201 RepID=UPI001C725A50|nr:protein FAR1-RELATED SEQUENCE 6-like [Carya illinoinensis]
MEKGKEHPSTLRPSSSNPESDIPSTSPNIPIHGYYGPVPAWSPAFLDANQYPSNLQNASYPIQHGMEGQLSDINTSSATSRFQGTEDNRYVVGEETDSPCTSSRVEEVNFDIPDEQETESGSAGTSKKTQMDDIDEPMSGMEFNSLEDLISYYKEYGKKSGFGVMTKRSERGEDETVRYVTLACARGGKARNRLLNVSNPRPTGKTECKAKINALKADDGKFRLTTVHNIHNHGLSPKKSRFFRCNREVSESVKRVLDTNDLAGIRMNKSFGSLVVGAGGFENLPFLEKDCRNYINKARHLRLGAGGAGALRDYFLRMQYKNPGFFALMDLDDDGRLKNVFWADPRSRAAYQYFGDVCMDGVAPKAIITDQDRAMKNAIAIIFPKSRHRFCLWHILKKVPEKLGCYGSYKSGMKIALMKCVYDTQKRKEFEKSWHEMISTYNLHDNVWLQSLYTERCHWVPAFLKDIFWAGMSTTQRSESMNAFFDGYVYAKTNLKESPIEKRYQDLYTNVKFREVQIQLTGIIDLDPVLHRREGTVKTYLVEDEVRVEDFTKQVTRSVDFNEEDGVAKCSCGLFEMRGIVCRHIFVVFKCNGIKTMPQQYILDRWRKDIKRRYTLINSSYDAGEVREDANRFSSLLNICYKMITCAAGSKKHTEDATTKLHAMIDLYSETQEPPSLAENCLNVGGMTKESAATTGSSTQVLSPKIVRGKGRPPSIRRASRMEKELRKRDGDDTHGVDTCRSLFGPSDLDVSNIGHVHAIPDRSLAYDIRGTQSTDPVIQTQQSMEFGLDGSQPLHVEFDGSQPQQ